MTPILPTEDVVAGVQAEETVVSHWHALGVMQVEVIVRAEMVEATMGALGKLEHDRSQCSQEKRVVSNHRTLLA